MADMRLQTMTGHLLGEGYFDKAVLPLGSTEWHGEHLPFGTDALVAQSLAEAVAGRVDGMLLLPTMPYGMSEHYAKFPATLTLSGETLIRVVSEVIDSIHSHGINRLLVINGHDGNIAPIEISTREYRVAHPDMKIAILEAWWVTAGKLLPQGTFEVWDGLGHGGEGETSMMLRVAPSLVNMSKARGVVPSLPPEVQYQWLFDEITPYGVTGDPTKATSEKGILMWNALVDHLVSFVNNMDKDGWDVGQSAHKG